jgi:hypothetical protein
MNRNQLTYEQVNNMLEVTEKDNTQISKAEKLIQDNIVDIESTMKDFEANLSSVPKGKRISLLELDSIYLSKNRCVRKISKYLSSDSESDFEEDEEPVNFQEIRTCVPNKSNNMKSDSESDFEEDEEPVYYQKARTCVPNKSNTKKKQTARKSIQDSLAGHDSLNLNRFRLASWERVKGADRATNEN